MTFEEKKHVYLKLTANLLIIFGFIFIVIGFGPVVYDNVTYYIQKDLGQTYILSLFDDKGDVVIAKPESVFGGLLKSRQISLSPANLDFSIAIEKIGLTAPVVANVSVNDDKKYMASLKNGIAHAVSSEYPSEFAGNTYLFAHSSFDFRLLGKYARSFNLLDKLIVGDKINIFYKGKDYLYSVTNSEILPGWNTRPLDRKVVSPVLTLQSCYPPGTTFNRIVITAELIDVREVK